MYIGRPTYSVIVTQYVGSVRMRQNSKIEIL